MSLVKTQELNKLQQSKGKYTMYIQGVHVYQSDLGQVQYICTYVQVQVHNVHTGCTCIPVRLGTSTIHLYLCTSTST